MDDEQLGEMLVKIAYINDKLSDEAYLKSLGGDALSYTGVKLAALRSSVLDLKVSAENDMNRKEEELYRVKAVAMKRITTGDDKVTATAAKDTKYAEDDVQGALKAFNDAKTQYNKLVDILRNSHTLVDAIKSRVIDLQGARKDERLG